MRKPDIVLTNSARSWSTPNVQLALVIGQIFFAGIGLAWWCVVGETLFITNWGAERMPWAFIVGAIFGPIISYGAIALQRRWSIGRMTLVTSFCIAAFCGLMRFGLLTPFSGWISLISLSAYYLSLQLAYIIVGALAGRLFDIRQMKRFFPLISAAFSLGYIVGSLAIPFLLARLASLADLLIGATVALLAALLFVVLLILTNRTVLAVAVRAHNASPPQPIHYLLRQRYVARAFGFQVLMAMNSCFLVFIFMRLAAAQFPTADRLASFYGPYMAVRDSITVLFALFGAGWLLNRFGLGMGLASNPAVVCALVAGMGVASLFLGAEHRLVFWLAAAAAALYINLSECLTLSSLKTVYAALPPQERQDVQTAVEGIGAPVANGLAGVVLLLLVAIPGLTLMHLLFFTLLVIAAWLVSGVLVYRDYAGMLVRSLSRRALHEAELSLNNSSSLAVVERLLHSTNVGEVRLALDLLEQVEHPALPAHLVDLVERGAAEMQVEALLRIAHQRVQSALRAVEARLQSPAPPQVHGAALRALCALTEADPVEAVAPFLTDAEPAVRLGAMTGLLRDGGIVGILSVGEQLTALTQAAAPAQRALAAQVIGEVGVNNFHQPLLPLLADNDPDVRRAALIAAQRVSHPRLLPLLVENLALPATRSAAVAALAASGEIVLPLVEQALMTATRQDVETARRLVRVCAQIKEPAVVTLLMQHLNHRNSEIQLQVLQALHRRGYRAEAAERAQMDAALLDCVRDGLQLILAQREIGEGTATAALYAALGEELRGVRQRVFLLLGLYYDARALQRAVEHLERGSTTDQALAIEALDVTLTGFEKAIILPLVDENRPLAQRQAILQQRFALPALEQTARLAEIIGDRTTWTLPWTRACAIYAAGKLGLHELTGAIHTALADEEPVVHETAIWALASLKRFSAAKTEVRRGAQSGLTSIVAAVAAS